MDAARFDVEDVCGDDYLYFLGERLAEQAEAQVELIWRTLELEPGMAVLDLACGHGRIANRLAERACRVTGIDALPSSLDLARRDAAEQGIDVTYVHGDMRELRWTQRFDRIVNWANSFGYFTDDDNRRVLAEAYRALRPGGRLLIETTHLPWIFTKLRDVVFERDGDRSVEQYTYDPLTGRGHVTRTVHRNGCSRSIQYSLRFLSFPEIRDWLLAAGFRYVDGYGETGEPLSISSRRMLAVAWRD